MKPLAELEIWFVVRQPAHVRQRSAAPGRGACGEIAAALDAAPAIPVRVVVQAGRDDAGVDRGG